MEGRGERAAVSAGGARRHRGDGQGRVRRPQHAGAGDAERDGPGHVAPGRLPRGVPDRAARRRVRVADHGQTIRVHGPDKQHVRTRPRTSRIRQGRLWFFASEVKGRAILFSI